MPSIPNRFKNAWNAFMNKDPTIYKEIGGSSYYRPYRSSRGYEKTIVNAVISRMAVDAASITVEHVQLDSEKRYTDTIDSDLNSCLNLEANIDQTGRAFMLDAIYSMLDEGYIAIVPTYTNGSPFRNNTFKIYELRVAKIADWRPRHVKVHVYNDITGKYEDIFMPKSAVAICENPFYSIMNATNSTAQKIARKLSILDVIDEQAGAGKMDLIIQLPYVVKGETRTKQAEERRKNIESQLANSKYGIAYIDGTEHVTQLNRSLENNILSQVEYLTKELYAHLGITPEIMNGTADEKTMTNYFSRTIEPIMSAIVDEMRRKFLTKTARTQGQSIIMYQDPFKLVPVSALAEIADKFTRNEILSSNEIRQIIGKKPSDDPRADELINSNMPQSEERFQNGGEGYEEEPMDDGYVDD